VQALLAAGANVDAELPGETALFEAARNGSMDIIPVLLRAGADPQARHHGETPAGTARKVGKLDAAQALEAATRTAFRPGPGRPRRPTEGELARLGLAFDEETFFKRVEAGDDRALASSSRPASGRARHPTDAPRSPRRRTRADRRSAALLANGRPNDAGLDQRRIRAWTSISTRARRRS
jgi:hypothetical protein